MSAAIGIAKHALLITAFVFVMMLVIEYLNVLTSGAWQRRLAGHMWGQYVLAAFLRATPGCLGIFAVVAVCSHGMLTVGAVVAAMIASSSDESSVMPAVIPRQAPLVTDGLATLGIVARVVADLVASRRKAP